MDEKGEREKIELKCSVCGKVMKLSKFQYELMIKTIPTCSQECAMIALER